MNGKPTACVVSLFQLSDHGLDAAKIHAEEGTQDCQYLDRAEYSKILWGYAKKVKYWAT
jgi:hypothetical protein